MVNGHPVAATARLERSHLMSAGPAGFSLNGNRCDTTVVLRTAAQSSALPLTAKRAKPPGVASPGSYKPKKPHGKHSGGGTDI